MLDTNIGTFILRGHSDIHRSMLRATPWPAVCAATSPQWLGLALQALLEAIEAFVPIPLRNHMRTASMVHAIARCHTFRATGINEYVTKRLAARSGADHGQPRVSAHPGLDDCPSARVNSAAAGRILI